MGTQLRSAGSLSGSASLQPCMLRTPTTGARRLFISNRRKGAHLWRECHIAFATFGSLLVPAAALLIVTQTRLLATPAPSTCLSPAAPTAFDLHSTLFVALRSASPSQRRFRVPSNTLSVSVALSYAHQWRTCQFLSVKDTHIQYRHKRK
jgi:hypothetical protein|uniref:Uncharacterized protein n=1 Tax=Zea mays TaxID=4577 RepID=A0A804LWT4_MAIZE